MNKLTFVLLALLIGVVACDSDSANKADSESVENTATEVATETTSAVDESLITPADISEEAQAEMYNFIMEYNQCMMKGRLESTTHPQQVQQAANDILMKCDEVLEQLKTHLLANNVNEALVIGMTNKMRSRGARNLMTKAMNNMAAQAVAAENAQKMGEETIPAQ